MASSKKPLTVRVRVPAQKKGKFQFVNTPIVSPIRPKLRSNGREYLTHQNLDVLGRGHERALHATERMHGRLDQLLRNKKITLAEYVRLRQRIESKSARLLGLIHRQTKRVGERDPKLNVLYNNTTFFRHLAKFLSARGKKPTSYFILDIDHFKKINDLHGHEVGDMALHFFANAVSKVSKQMGGFAGRFGGEEIVVAIPRNVKQAYSFVKRLDREMRESFERESVVRSRLQGNLFTFSAGVHEVKLGETAESMRELADQHLYRSKREGRDMVTVLYTSARGNNPVSFGVRRDRVR